MIYDGHFLGIIVHNRYILVSFENMTIFNLFFLTGNVKYIGLVASCESVSETCGPLTLGSKATESFSF